MTRKTVNEQDREVLLRATPDIIHSAQVAWRDVAATEAYTDAMFAMRDYADEYIEYQESATIVLSERTDNLSEVHAQVLTSAYAHAAASREGELTEMQSTTITLRWDFIVEYVEAAG